LQHCVKETTIQRLRHPFHPSLVNFVELREAERLALRYEKIATLSDFPTWGTCFAQFLTDDVAADPKRPTREADQGARRHQPGDTP
jgi:hypothetical protein